MKKIMGLLLMLSTVLGLSACGGGDNQQAMNTNSGGDAQEAHILYVGTNAEFAPFEYLGDGGVLQGFDVDLMKAIGEVEGLKVVFKDQPFDSLSPGLIASKDFDAIIAGMTITKERQETMEFSNPYFEVQQVILVPENEDVKSVNDLKKLNKIGVAIGQTGDLVAQKIFGASSNKIARFQSIPLVLKELENSGVSAVISDNAVIKNYLHNNPNSQFKIIEADDFFEPEFYGVAVRKGDTKTLDLINSGLEKIRADGTYQKIYSKYFVE